MPADKIAFNVYHVPVPQPRQRHRYIPTLKRVHNYTPSKHPVQAYKAAFLLAAQNALAAIDNDWDIEAPMIIRVTFVLPRPKGLSKKKYPKRQPMTVKPDLDNFLKGSLDSCIGTLWKDDGLLFDVHMRKFRAAVFEEPRVEVELERWTA